MSARRVDTNQASIVGGLRRCGATVRHLHTVGHGLPDLIVGYEGQNYLIELKTESGILTPAESEFFCLWQGQAAIARTLDDALVIIGAKEE